MDKTEEVHVLGLIKKKPGVFKDEFNGQIGIEFVGLQPKMYSVLTTECEKKRAKGVSKAVIDKQITHDHYKNVLFNEQDLYCVMTNIQSKLHQIFKN